MLKYENKPFEFMRQYSCTHKQHDSRYEFFQTSKEAEEAASSRTSSHVAVGYTASTSENRKHPPKPKPWSSTDDHVSVWCKNQSHFIYIPESDVSSRSAATAGAPSSPASAMGPTVLTASSVSLHIRQKIWTCISETMPAIQRLGIKTTSPLGC